MAATSDPALADRMRQMSLHGLSHDAWKRFEGNSSWDYRIVAPGYKYNMTDIAAAIGCCQLARAEELRREREAIAAAFLAALADVERDRVAAGRSRPHPRLAPVSHPSASGKAGHRSEPLHGAAAGAGDRLFGPLAAVALAPLLRGIVRLAAGAISRRQPAVGAADHLAFVPRDDGGRASRASWRRSAIFAAATPQHASRLNHD